MARVGGGFGTLNRDDNDHLACPAVAAPVFHVEHFGRLGPWVPVRGPGLDPSHQFWTSRAPAQLNCSLLPLVARIIAISNQKGGVGKTTTAINLAASLAIGEARTLLIDSDPQSNATSGLGIARTPERITLYQVLRGEAEPDQAIVATEWEDLHVLPASRDLVGLNIELVADERRESKLSAVVEQLRARYAFIVIDAPPALDLLTLNALVAADAIIVPMQCEYFALEGISQLLDTIGAVRQNWNPKLEIEGILFTQFDERTTLARQVAENLREYFGDKIFRTRIPRNIRLAEAPSHGKPVIAYDVRSKGAEAYLQLAKEVMEHEQSRKSTACAGSGN
jgi:chromosome partitioning protein